MRIISQLSAREVTCFLTESSERVEFTTVIVEKRALWAANHDSLIITDNITDWSDYSMSI